jgi:uncharacterized phage protein (TIGR01671 family)
MRPIETRAWDKKNKTMIYSGFGISCNGEAVLLGAGKNGPTYTWTDNLIPIQYTGLKDKNGVKIFEGDIFFDKEGMGIVKFGEWISHDVYDCGETAILGFYVEQTCTRIDGSKYTMDHTILHYDGEEIAGNIHQNPELLENKCQKKN